MRRIRTAAALALGLFGSALVGSPSAGQEAEGLLPATADPNRAPAGDTVTVSGADCMLKDMSGSLAFGFTTEVASEEVDLIPLVSNRANDDGTWAFEITIPTQIRTGGVLAPVEPGPHYRINAVCVSPDTPSEHWRRYAPIPFEVIAPGPTTANPVAPATAPNAAPSSSTMTATATAPLAATPIASSPAFTG